MDGTSETAKTKTLAVFENVITKKRQRKRKKFKPHRFADDESSPSESELVIDDEVKEEESTRKRSEINVRLKKELLNLVCQWNGCCMECTDYVEFYTHLLGHVKHVDDLECKWVDCPSRSSISSSHMLVRHISYHGYLTKLINIGKNVLERNELPDCSAKREYTFDIPDSDYVCEWKDCNYITFTTIQNFLNHMECHILAGSSTKTSNDITCEWSGCTGKFTTRYKLGDHVRIHTKERVIACPTCMSLFTTKTTFSDHRKRQVSLDMRSYQCSQCLKLFSAERLLSDHMRSHINQYKCTLCDMTATKPSMLAKHIQFKHMSIRPFKCAICSKTFVTKSNLNTHLIIHQAKPFKCEQCEFGCKSKVGLRNHMSKVHGMENAVYECQVCKVRFKRGDYLTRHLIQIHKFHWPSGHCRFRYRKDSDGIRRLQTVRYESLEVTEQMIKSESMQPVKNTSAVMYNVTYDKDAADEYKLTVVEEFAPKEDVDSSVTKLSEYNFNHCTNNIDDIIIVIEDVDECGKVINTREISSKEIVLDGASQKSKRDMPAFETVYVKSDP